MKRFTFLLLTALVMLTATAQNADVVTPPEDLQTAEYALKAQSFNYGTYTPVTKPLMIGFQDNDVYLQGLCEYLPQAWIKGTRNGNTVTFAKGQYFGATTGMDYSEYPMYFGGCESSWVESTEDVTMTDVVMTLDEQGNMTTDTWLLVNSEESTVNPYVALANNTIVKLHDKAATPANPSVVEFMPYSAANGYAGVSLNIPTTDVNGEPIMVSKLYYKIYTDIEKDIQPMVFIADEHLYIDEDMTEIPYTFTDQYDIEYGGYAAYWYHDTKDLNRIGVQSIYRGGNEEHNSEIVWYDIKPYADEAVTFDFNGLNPDTTPVSNNNTHAGDITEDLTLQEGNVTLTISPSGVNTPNRYWLDYNLQAIQLRLYGGTMTFEVPEGYSIEKMYFNASDWNDYNEFDCGDFDGKVWTGATNNCVLTICGDGGNTKLNSIAVVVKDVTGLSKTVTLNVGDVLRSFDVQGRVATTSTRGLVIEQRVDANGKVHVTKRIRK